MTRQKVARHIGSWQEADETLLEIGRLERQMEGMEANLQTFIEDAKNDTVVEVKPLLEKRNLLALELELFCEAHREEFGDKKSRELNFGKVSFRQSTRIIIKGLKACVESLKDKGWLEFLRVTEAPNKDKMKELSDQQLAELGAKRKRDDVFAYEIDRERVREAL